MRTILISICLLFIGCQTISKEKALQEIQKDNWIRVNTQLSSGEILYYEYRDVTPDSASATAKELFHVKFKKNNKTEFYKVEISLQQILPLAVKDLYEYNEIYSLGGQIINHYIFD